MKWLLIAVLALGTLIGFVRAEGPDDKYIEIYKVIEDGDRLSASGQAQLARQRYIEAQTELKKLQASYPNWNQKLVEFRLRLIESKVSLAPMKTPPPGEEAPGAKAAVQDLAPKKVLPSQPVAPRTQPEVDDRDAQIKALRDQAGRLQNDKTVLEAKLREALAAQPAALDPRELARAEDRIRVLEKEKEVLKISVQVAESRAASQNESGAAEMKKALAGAKQKLAEQNDLIIALRQEKEVLQKRSPTAKGLDDETLRVLRAENADLKKRLAEKPRVLEPQHGAEPADKELVSTKAALQSSRDAVASLQVRLRTIEEERDRLEKTRRDLESRLAAASAAPPPSSTSESVQIRRLQKERDDLQKKLNDTIRQQADSKSKTKQTPPRTQLPGEDVSGLRARLEALEARKVPYTPEELALFKKPQEPTAVTAPPAEQPPGKELPPSAAPLLAEAQRALVARRFDEAEKKYLEVLKLDDKNVATLQRLASAQLEQNRPKEAEVTLKRALEQNTTDARTLLLMGIAQFDQDKFDEALDDLSRSAQADPQNAETQNYLGITLSQKGQQAAAETALRKAIQISPNYNSAHYNLAVVYATQKPPFTELARWHYQKALAFGHPPNPEFEKMIEKKQSASPK